MEGTIIGQYRIVRPIGAGGMGAVYLAEHVLVGRRAAIKILLPELSVRRAVVTRFFNEARAMTSIPDPGIVAMYDFGFHTDGSAYIVMEALEGETLDHRRKRLQRLPLVDALRITRQVAGSLATAHAHGVIHRDLKPENIFIVRDQEALGGERPKVLDFGIAKLSGDTERSHTLTGAMMGTPVYMSPEQCRGAGQVDTRSDIYSLGCVLFFLVTGRPPFDRIGVGELISAHINDAPVPPSAIAPGLPDDLDQLVLRCLEKSPARRFQTMLELQAACDALLARLSTSDVVLPATTLVPALPDGFRSHDTPVMDASTPTTLSSAAGVTAAPLRPRRIGIWIGFGGTALVAIAMVVLITNGRTKPAPAAARPTEPAVSAPPPVAASPAPLHVIPAPAVISIDAGVALPDAPAARPTPKPKPHAAPHADDLYDDR